MCMIDITPAISRLSMYAVLIVHSGYVAQSGKSKHVMHQRQLRRL
jgi:hypothetical protein